MRNGPDMRSRPVAVLLVGLALTLLVSGCGGASPETGRDRRRPHVMPPRRRLCSARPGHRLAREPVFAMDQERRDPDGRGVSAHRDRRTTERADHRDWHGCADAGGAVITAPALTDAVIATAMARPMPGLCRQSPVLRLSGSARGCPRVVHAEGGGARSGARRVILANAGRDSWDVWPRCTPDWSSSSEGRMPERFCRTPSGWSGDAGGDGCGANSVPHGVRRSALDRPQTAEGHGGHTGDRQRAGHQRQERLQRERLANERQQAVVGRGCRSSG